jgi:hypothetical protein
MTMTAMQKAHAIFTTDTFSLVVEGGAGGGRVPKHRDINWHNAPPRTSTPPNDFSTE